MEETRRWGRVSSVAAVFYLVKKMLRKLLRVSRIEPTARVSSFKKEKFINFVNRIKMSSIYIIVLPKKSLLLDYL